MAKGRVKWFSTDKRFGFIAQADGPDVFVHLNDVEGGRPLREGEAVEFKVTQTDRGLRAISVRRVSVADEEVEGVVEKPYAFVPEVRAHRKPLAPEAGHERFAPQCYSGRLAYRLQALTHLFVASGRYALSKDVGFDQGQVVRSCYRVAGRPAVPGSSLKGAVRAVFEAVTPSCAVTDHRESCRAQSGQNPELCPACAVFGAMGYLGRVRFGDAVWREGQTELYHLQALYRPRRRGGRKFYRHGRMQEDPNNEPIEVIPQGSFLEGALNFEDLSAEEVGALCFALGLDGSFCLKLGGGKPACLGSVIFDPQEIIVHADGRWLRSDDGEQVYRGDAALTFIREQVQAAQDDYLQMEAVEALRSTLRYPNDRSCPTGMY